MDRFSHIANVHPNFLESQYKKYKESPEEVEEGWAKFFEGFDLAMSKGLQEEGAGQLSPKELKVWNLIEAYRHKAHLISKTNPIRERKDRHANLKLEDLGFSEDDLDEEFHAGESLGLGKTTLQNILDHLDKIYCRSIGFEYSHVTKPEEQEWLRENIEKEAKDINYPIEKKKRILEKLNETVVFEKFLNTKYIGQKRFSLEGGETTIPALSTLIDESTQRGAEEIVLGMAHRGRLNVLANLLGKTYEEIFSEFEGDINPQQTMGDGDVKYHLGFSSDVETESGKKIKIKLAPNPSHLEAVTPVVEGYARAKGNQQYDNDFSKTLPILIHGDAALTGQGVIYETLQMSKLPGFRTGGTVHFVINNQIGFTTDFDEARSSHYSTSIATAINAPIIHVNGDDVEAVIYAVELAARYRQKFNKDVFVDMVCYRRHGHNEGDDPKFTQPNLYQIISNHPNPREVYTKELIETGAIESELAKKLDREFWDNLQEKLNTVRENGDKIKQVQPTESAWEKYRRPKPEDFGSSPDTSITQKDIDKVVNGLIDMPEDFQPLSKVQRMLKRRREKYFDAGKLDWASAELLAYGSLLDEGTPIRMSGQDVIRGTFSHRHSILYDAETDEEFNRLNNISEEQEKFRIFNSPLSEFGVLGFEYGYSIAAPDALTIWEAQFGDFCNGAQTIIDQFITSSESKWQQMSGLVMLLPHGYEGQGPEHSSARLERFLQLCAEYNMTVANCTTPANFFHLLRRQVARPFRHPLIHMAPKSLLRHPKCISNVSDIKEGGFQEVIDDPINGENPDKVKRVLFCSGKVYYDLLERQEEEEREDVAIVRLEQLYPLPQQQMDEIVQKYKKAEFKWVQEEPANMGAWTFITTNYDTVKLERISRKASSSPATGYKKLHKKEQQAIIDKSFDLPKKSGSKTTKKKKKKKQTQKT